MRNQTPSATNTQLGHDMWNGPVRFDCTLATVASESQRRPIVSLGQLDVTEALGPWANLRAQVLHQGSQPCAESSATPWGGPGAATSNFEWVDWDAMMDVNLKGLFFVTQAVARTMAPRGYGRIVNISSQAGLVGIRRHAVYSAGKGGVNMLTRVLALEWALHGVTVNAVAPTFIRTPGTADRLDDPEFAADVLARIPVGHFGTTADVAAAVIYLASPAAGLVTGTVLPVDGGWTAQ